MITSLVAAKLTSHVLGSVAPSTTAPPPVLSPVGRAQERLGRAQSAEHGLAAYESYAVPIAALVGLALVIARRS